MFVNNQHSMVTLYCDNAACFQRSHPEFNPFAPGDFAEKRVLKLVEWFSGHCRAKIGRAHV